MDVSSFRNKNGEGYYTVVSDDLVIRWKPLSIEQFFLYDDLIKKNYFSFTVLEDEIFRQCVLDKEVVKDLDYLPAGIVSLVVHNILFYSGPSSIDDFNDLLEANRSVASSPLHQLAPLILRAFPSYKLEDIYTLPYEVFMLRLAQAEQLLIKLGVITEPLSLEKPKPKKQKPNLSPDQLKSIWEKQKVPVKNLDEERIAIENASGSFEAEDPAERSRMIQESARIYKENLSKMEFYKKK